MARQYISESLKGFVREQIQTVLRLEVLLLLHRDQLRSFNAADVALELGFEREVAKEELRALTRLGLLGQSNTDKTKYHYQPVSVGAGALVDELAATYSMRRVPILSLLLNDCADRPRVFAEAFRLIKGVD